MADFKSSAEEIEKHFHSKQYQLIEKIGEGGFGIVYKAKQHSTQQVVAIKFLMLPNSLNDLKKQRYIERFHREVDLISRLNHPNIVQIIDKGQHSNLLYSVYEYIDGQSLKEQLQRNGALDVATSVSVMANVLDALSHAHEKGVIHRDIKPGNIMLYQVGANTHVKVLDFGIGALQQEARHLDYKSLTLTQETLGTPAYSAPEQLRGEPPIPQTDIYVWGLVFLECLTGKPAISGSSLAAIFHQQLSTANVPLGVLAGHESANLMRRVLNKKAQERPANALDLYHQFTKINFSNLITPSASLPQNAQSKAHTRTSNGLNADFTSTHTQHTQVTERKQIAVLSLIVGFEQQQHVSVQQQEALDALLFDQQQQCIDIALRYGAYHAGTLADTLLFYFGYPQATDNDSRLCSRTALEIASTLQKRSALLQQTHGVTCHARMGMQIGMMLSLSGNVPEGKIARDANELSRQAQPNHILCSENVRQRLSTHLRFEQYRATSPSQTTAPTFALMGELRLEAFGFIRGTQKSPIFVGRDDELQKLHDCVHASTSPIHIQGEAGVGKSRLIYELRNRCQQHWHLIAQCLPEYKSNALHPILNLIRFKFSLESIEPERAHDQLQQALMPVTMPSEHKKQGLMVLLSWLNLPMPEAHLLANLSPDVQKQRLFNVLAQLLCLPSLNAHAASSYQGSLFVFEDMHWADPTSIAFIEYMMSSEVFQQSNHSWLTTSREPLPDALNQSPFQTISLKKLTQQSTESFIRYLFEGQPVATQLLEMLLERTDGVPLFIEELVGFLQSQKRVHKVNGQYNFVDETAKSQIPLTLRDSLQHKLDALTFGKDTVQLAAAIGREFDYRLLTLASTKEEAQVQHDLENLLHAELIFRQRKVDGDSYLFKHALVRDAAYDSMGTATQRCVHHAIALAITNEPNRSISPTIVAQHFALAEDYEQATYYGLLGMKAAVQTSSNQEAISLGQSVMTWSENARHPNFQHLGALFTIETQLPAQLSLFGYGSEQVQASTQAASQLINSVQNPSFNALGQTQQGKSDLDNTALLDDDTQTLENIDTTGVSLLLSGLGIDSAYLFQEKLDEIHFKITWTEYLFEHYKPNRYRAEALGQSLLKRYAPQSTKAPFSDKNRQKYMTVKLHLAQNYMTLGQHQKAREYYQAALALYDDEQDKTLAAEYGTEAKSQNLSLSAEVDLMFGEVSLAYSKLAQALQHADKLGHNTSVIFAHIVIAQVAAFDKDYDRVIAITKEYEAKYGDTASYFECYLYLYYHCATDNTEAALQALEQQINTGQLFAISYYVTHLAEAYLRQNEVKKATELMQRWLQNAIENDDIGALPFLKKVMADCYYHQDRSLTPRVEDLLVESIQAAHAQQAHYFELENRIFLWTLQHKEQAEKATEAKNLQHILTLASKVEVRGNSKLYRDMKQLNVTAQLNSRPVNELD